MNFFETLEGVIRDYPERTFYRYKDTTMTYAEFGQASDRLAGWIRDHIPTPGPICVYGHKDPLMLVAFLACVKAGHPYVPLDTWTPLERILQTIDVVEPSAIFSTKPLEGIPSINARVLETAASSYESPIEPSSRVQSRDDFYIVFTSGSTGRPKGVCISLANLENFLDWGLTLFDAQKPQVFLNTAPFSFDLSVMEIYSAMMTGSSIYATSRSDQERPRVLMTRLRESNASVWVSTPSFGDFCLRKDRFRQTLMPDLKTMIFCGEILANSTALEFIDRFPKARLVNVYGPSESTCACAGIEITRQMAESEKPIPIGFPRPGTKFYLRDSDNNPIFDGVPGELVIEGDTVSRGYYRNPDLTAESFEDLGGGILRYFTGDSAWFEKGMWYFNGRLDYQIKFKGYRVELGDIEANLLQLPEVSKAVCLPRYKKGVIVDLVCFVLMHKDAPFDEQALLKALSERIPSYMMPRDIYELGAMPLTTNGKINRSVLRKMIE